MDFFSLAGNRGQQIRPLCTATTTDKSEIFGFDGYKDFNRTAVIFTAIFLHLFSLLVCIMGHLHKKDSHSHVLLCNEINSLFIIRIITDCKPDLSLKDVFFKMLRIALPFEGKRASAIFFLK